MSVQVLMKEAGFRRFTCTLWPWGPQLVLCGMYQATFCTKKVLTGIPRCRMWLMLHRTAEGGWRWCETHNAALLCAYATGGIMRLARSEQYVLVSSMPSC